jgi:hypothetical protein
MAPFFALLITRRSRVRIPPPLSKRPPGIRGFYGFLVCGGGWGAGAGCDGVQFRKKVWSGERSGSPGGCLPFRSSARPTRTCLTNNRRRGNHQLRGCGPGGRGFQSPGSPSTYCPLAKPIRPTVGGAGHLTWGTIGEQFCLAVAPLRSGTNALSRRSVPLPA